MVDPRQHRDPGASACGREKRGQTQEALGRSAGGFSTKIHAAVDALGNPVRLVVTEGQEADFTQAEPTIRAHRADAYMGDKGYDSDKVIKAARRRGARAIIPPRKNRKVAREYDKHTYKERVKVEWFFSLLKQYRRVATRYDKTKHDFLAFVHVASVMILLR